MLINTGLRTDIVHHYSDWMFRRFREGYVYSRNPLFPHKISCYELTPQLVDAVLFCSKNYAPALPRLKEITEHYRTLFHYTINGYGAPMEPSTPPFSDTFATLCALEKLVGREKIVWRYDPIVLSDIYTVQWHAEQFGALAARLRPHIAFCIVNFVDRSTRLPKKIPAYHAVSDEEKRALLTQIGKIGIKYSLPVRLCGIGEEPAIAGIARKACVRLDDIALANGCTFKSLPHTGNRRDCDCIPSRDIGWYDCCPSRCLYCNANRSDAETEANLALHEPDSPLLIGHPDETDEILHGKHGSILNVGENQLSLFEL